MMKKSVLFVVNSLDVGGVEKCLVTILNALPRDKYDITVGVVNRRGGFMEAVPAHVKVVEIDSLHRYQWIWRTDRGVLREMLRPDRFTGYFMIPALRVISKLKGTLIPLYSHYINRSTDQMPRFDIAVAFQGPSQILDYYVGKVVRAKKKIGWIHFDVDKFYINPITTANAYAGFSRVFVVSEESRKSFERKVPSLASRTETMMNFIDTAQVRIDGDKESPLSHQDQCKQLVTVGRLRSQKGQDIALRAAALLKAKGYNFHWTFVGDGNRLAEYQALATQLGITDRITFAGSTTNPYPYMKHCDIYVQPSRFEGFCLTIGEAKVFGVPIVATEFQGAHEQLDGLENAVIVKETTPEAIADGIERAWTMRRVAPEPDGVPTQITRLMEVFDS